MKKLLLLGLILTPVLLFAGPDPKGILELEGYGNSDAVGITAKRTRGDFTIQEALASGDNLFLLSGYGFDGTSMSSTARARLAFATAQAWTAENQGTSIRFSVTPNGSTTMAEAVRISSNGYVGIGTTNPSAALDVAGGINASGAVTFGASSLLAVTSITVSNQNLWGTGSSISTMTPTALNLDDGLTLTNAGVTVLNGNNTLGNAGTDNFTVGSSTMVINTWGLYVATATNSPTPDFMVDTTKKLLVLPRASDIDDAITPLFAGSIVYNTTSNEVCVATGTLSTSWARLDVLATPCTN